LSFVVGEFDEGAAMIDRALALNPNLAGTWLRSGWQRIYLGEPDLAIEHLTRAIRLSPLDPFTFYGQQGLALAHLFAGRYEDALSWAQKSVQGRPNWRAGMRILPAAAALSGRLKEAQQAMARNVRSLWVKAQVDTWQIIRDPLEVPCDADQARPCVERWLNASVSLTACSLGRRTMVQVAAEDPIEAASRSDRRHPKRA
jgi:tetratricopeptide (TPR) repeat protein